MEYKNKLLIYQDLKCRQISVCFEDSLMEDCLLQHGKSVIGVVYTDKSPEEIRAGFNYDSTREIMRFEDMYTEIFCAVANVDGNKTKVKEQRKRAFEARKFRHLRLFGKHKEQRNIDSVE